MKKGLGLFLRTIAFLLIFVICLSAVSLIVERKSSYIKNEMFFEEASKDHLDVLLFGSSHVINGINPLQLFEEQGFTSYNLGGFGSVLMSSYWQMELALEYCTPKLVVIDTYMLENDIRFVDDPNANVNSDELHLNIDRFPLSKTKYAAVSDMFSARDKQYPFLFDFIVYHDRWKELNRDDFRRMTGTANINKLMGAELEYGVHSAAYTYNDYGTGALAGETVSTSYLRRLIEKCQSKGIEVAVVTLPFLAMEENQAAAHSASQIASEYGVPEINMLEVGGLVDYNTDFMDPGHMNVLGSAKVTSYLGNWISSNFDLPDHREDSSYDEWHQLIGEYNDDRQDKVMGNEDLYSQGLFLNIEQANTSFVISIMGNSKSYYDEAFIRQLRSLGAGSELDKALSDKSPYLLISDHGQITEISGFEGGREIDTSNGSLYYEPVVDIYRVLRLGDDQDTNYIYSEDYPYADIQLLFLEDGQITNHQYYICDNFSYNFAQQ
nr:hypothetical protein [uncultured Butyrivibrio sp.]